MGLALHGGRGVAETEGARGRDFCQRGSSKQLLGDTRLQSRVPIGPSRWHPVPPLRSSSGFIAVLRRNGDRVGTRPSAWPQSLPCRPGGRERPRDWLKGKQSFEPHALVSDSVPGGNLARFRFYDPSPCSGTLRHPVPPFFWIFLREGSRTG